MTLAIGLSPNSTATGRRLNPSRRYGSGPGRYHHEAATSSIDFHRAASETPMITSTVTAKLGSGGARTHLAGSHVPPGHRHRWCEPAARNGGLVPFGWFHPRGDPAFKLASADAPGRLPFLVDLGAGRSPLKGTQLGGSPKGTFKFRRCQAPDHWPAAAARSRARAGSEVIARLQQPELAVPEDPPVRSRRLNVPLTGQQSHWQSGQHHGRKIIPRPAAFNSLVTEIDPSFASKQHHCLQI